MVMEVSSHALTLGRADAVVFAAAAFTNLGRDHLDFHSDEEAYFEAKASLFVPERTRHAVVNVDDPRGPQLAERVAGDGRVELTTVSRAVRRTGRWTRPARRRPDRRTRAAAEPSRHVHLGLPGPSRAERHHRPGHGGRHRRGRGGGRRWLAEASCPAGCSGCIWARARRWSTSTSPTRTGGDRGLEAVGSRRRIAVLGCGGDREPGQAAADGAASARHADLVVSPTTIPQRGPRVIRADVLAGAGRRRRG